MKNKLYVLVSLMGLSAAVFASESPTSLATDPRIKVVPFEKNNVVPVRVQTRNSTQIVFDKGESIQEIEGSDNGALQVSPKNLSGLNYFFIKPVTYGYDANLTVLTDKHTYYFHIIGNKRPVDSAYKYTYAVQFTYPQELQAIKKSKKAIADLAADSTLNKGDTPADYNWNYSFSGARSIMPIHVYDDGKFTYFEMQPHQAVPAIFAVDDKQGHESVVNFRTKGNYLVVERLAPQFTLRNGQTAVASVFNNNMIHKMRQDGEA
ncbi:MAG: P-type conjugative transfer protein VirB9 [Legionellales bacterium]|nr:P-type conjugative transfer protein VirB9 [Legionellales bacterium]|tara:strand:- start:2247 stop:3035 length:789 start_codon:yes stop_codon:yes gene_type:complete